MKPPLISKKITLATTLIASFVMLTSLLGLFSTLPYALETQNWRLQAQGQDIGNLVGVVVLLVSMRLAIKGSLNAYLAWLGTLFYFLYAFIIYAFAVHFNRLFIVYVAVLGLTIYTLLFALSKKQPNISITSGSAKKLASLTLIGTGILFAALWLSEIVPAIILGKIPQSLHDAGLWVNPVHVIDLSTILPAFILTGLLVKKNQRWGIFYVMPWLLFSVLMGCSILAAMLLMIANGYHDTLPAMIIVTLVVVLSLVSLLNFSKQIR